MIAKAHVLMKMQKTGQGGKRTAFQIGFVTADRALYRKMLELQGLLKQFEEGSEPYNALLRQIEKCDVSGKFIASPENVLSGPRGMHATREKIEKENPEKNPHNSANRTRNILMQPANVTRKLHNSLIFYFNHEEVIY